LSHSPPRSELGDKQSGQGEPPCPGRMVNITCLEGSRCGSRRWRNP
jgi:hypothetical protein